MPPPIRELADRYLYHPPTVKVKSANLTVDTVEQFRHEVKTADKPEQLVEVLASSGLIRRSSSRARRSAPISCTASCATAG